MNNQINIFDKKQVNEILDALKTPNNVNRDYIYEVYSLAMNAIGQLMELSLFDPLSFVNSIEILEYCIGEYIYTTAIKNKEQIEAFINDEKIQSSMATIVVDKYVSLSQFKYHERTITNLYYPPISSLNVYLNFMLSILHQYNKNDPASTLITDLLLKSISIAKCSLSLLVDGFETEAFSSWRTLHECECTLILLDKYKNNLIDTYLKHMQYGIAFKDVMSDKNKQTEIFLQMKEEMKQFDLKSKDIKKYIEYGWLYSIPEFKDDPSYKLNFRDGLEKICGLSSYNQRYEMSSEIIHSTPMLIYSNKEYFYFVTLLSLYESFFRLEKVFVSLFSKRVNEQQMERYKSMRDVYYSQLVNIHSREQDIFKIWQTNNAKKRSL